MEIIIDDNLKQTINNINNDIMSLETNYNSVKNQIDLLRKNWIGSDSDSFCNKYENEFYQTFKDTIYEMKKYKTFIEKGYQTYEEIDEEYGKDIEWE